MRQDLRLIRLHSPWLQLCVCALKEFRFILLLLLPNISVGSARSWYINLLFILSTKAILKINHRRRTTFHEQIAPVKYAHSIYYRESGHCGTKTCDSFLVTIIIHKRVTLVMLGYLFGALDLVFFTVHLRRIIFIEI